MLAHQGLICLRCNYTWQNSIERAALSERAAHSYCTKLSLDNMLRKSQTQACTLEPLGGAAIKLLKLDEEALQVLWSDAHAGILHFKKKGILTLRSDVNLYMPFFASKFDGVGEIVVQNLLQLG